jgi:hypothetical protein
LFFKTAKGVSTDAPFLFGGSGELIALFQEVSAHGMEHADVVIMTFT